MALLAATESSDCERDLAERQSEGECGEEGRRWALGRRSLALLLGAVCLALLGGLLLPRRMRHKLLAMSANAMLELDPVTTVDASNDDGVGYACFESGVDYQGQDLYPNAPTTTMTAGECKQMCVQDPACKYFTWLSDSRHMCWLKSSNIGRQSAGGVVSGPRRCATLSAADEPLINSASVSHELCNGSLPLLTHVIARSFSIPAFWENWCKDSRNVEVEQTWIWPGRDWCWHNVKAESCYREDQPNWWWAQKHASEYNGAPDPNAILMSGLDNPTLCDQIYYPPAEVAAPELEQATAWAEANLAVYVINLAGAEERWRLMQERLKSVGLTPTRVEGVNMKVLGIDAAKIQGFVPEGWNYTLAQENVWDIMQKTPEYLRRPWFYNAIGIGTVGCAAAHLKAQREAATLAVKTGKQLALVLEDDVVVEPDFIVKLHRLLRDEAPCDWEVVSLVSRCAHGTCVSPHLSRVEPDGNEPTTRCRTSTNFGTPAILYRASEIYDVQSKLLDIMFDESLAGCMPIDIAFAAISDRMAYYAVPSSLQPGLAHEEKKKPGINSDRMKLNEGVKYVS